MLDNSLKIRGKFINKLGNKLEDLHSDLILLSKVDRKIYKKINIQKGGAPPPNANLASLQLSTYLKKKELDKQQGKIQSAIETARELSTTIDRINVVLKQIQEQIETFEIKEMESFPDFNMKLTALSPNDILVIATALENETEWKEDAKIAELITKDEYNIFLKRQRALGTSYTPILIDELVKEEEEDEKNEEGENEVANKSRVRSANSVERSASASSLPVRPPVRPTVPVRSASASSLPIGPASSLPVGPASVGPSTSTPKQRIDNVLRGEASFTPPATATPAIAKIVGDQIKKTASDNDKRKVFASLDTVPATSATPVPRNPTSKFTQFDPRMTR